MTRDTPSTPTARDIFRGLLLVLCIFLVARAVLRPRGRPAPRLANVVLVIADSLRAENLGVYGYGRDTSPYIDAWAENAIVFENAFSHYSYTWPTISNLFTGIPFSALTTRNLFTTPGDRKGGLHPDNDTLAERLQASGVATAAVSGSPYILREHGFAQGFDRFQDWEAWDPGFRDQTPRRFTAEEVNVVARSTINELVREGKPWFLYLHYFDTHMAYRAPERDRDLFVDPDYRRERRVIRGAAMREEGGFLKFRTAQEQPWFTDEDVAALESEYDAEIHHFDRGFHRLLVQLEQAGVLEDTIVVLTSDHGEALFEREFWGHGFLSRSEEQHVPLIVSRPGERGERISEPVTTTELFHALLAHFEAPPAQEGLVLARRADPFARRGAAVVYTEGPGETRVLRDGRHALYLYGNIEERFPLPTSNGRMLFDVHTDPQERNDLLASAPEEAGARADRLLAEALSGIGTADAGWEDPMERAGGAVRARLEALGYLD